MNDLILIIMNEIKVKVNGVYKTIRNLYKRANGSYRYIGEVEKKVGNSYKEFPMGFPRSVQGAAPLTIPDARAKKLMQYMIYGKSQRSITIDGKEYIIPDSVMLHEYVKNNAHTMVDTGVNCSDDMEFYCHLGCDTLGSFYLLQRRSSSNLNINGVTGANNGAKISLSFNGSEVISDITRTVGHVYAIKGTVLNGNLTLHVKDETTGTEDTKTGTYTVGTIPTDNVTMFGNANGDNLQSGHKVYEAYIKKNGSYAWCIIGDYDVIGKSVITASRGTLGTGPELPLPSASAGVVGVGDMTENLFEPDDANTRYPNGWYPANNVVSNATSNRTTVLPCSEGDVFTYKHYTQASSARYFWIYSDTPATGEPCSRQYGDIYGTGPITTDPAPSNAKYICFGFWRAGYGTIQSAADDFVIVKGSTAPTSYIPYGYKTPLLTAQNCGMVDLSTLSWTNQGTYFRAALNDADFPSSSSLMASMYVRGLNIASASNLVSGTIAGHTPASTPYLYIKDDSVSDVAGLVTKYSGVNLFYKRTTDTSWTTPTKQNIYIGDKQLHKVGNYSDYIDYENQRIVRNVGVKVLDGTENWAYGANSSGCGFYRTFSDCDTTNHTWEDIGCTHLRKRQGKYQYHDNLTIGYWAVNSNSITVRFDEKIQESSADAFKSWLAAQYAAGTPVIVYYPLAAPTYESITAPDIVLEKGTNYLDIETEVKPSNISANYLKRTNIIQPTPADLSLLDINGAPLQSQNTANCYVIHGTGLYKFPLVYGNGIKNGAANTSAYTPQQATSYTGEYHNYLDEAITSPYIETDTGVSAASVAVAYSDMPTNEFTISDLALEDGDACRYVSFRVAALPSRGGNAVICIKDAQGVTMWSWHIWAYPDTLETSTIGAYSGENIDTLSVYLGFVKDSDDAKYGTAPYYQWGRKDPMLRFSNSNLAQRADVGYGDFATFTPTEDAVTTSGFAIRNPNRFFTPMEGSHRTWLYEDGEWGVEEDFANVNYWDARLYDRGTVVHGKPAKTIYDPCPVGFVVPSVDVYNILIDAFHGAQMTSYDKGRIFANCYYPYLCGLGDDGNKNDWPRMTFMWNSCVVADDGYAEYLESVATIIGYYGALFSNPPVCGLNIRPMKE